MMLGGFMTKTNTSVANYISQQLSLCGKTQAVVCADLGYENANVLTMFKQGKTKLPISKVKALANSLEVDSIYLLKLVMTEYMPNTWDVIQDILGRTIITESETQILKIIREGSEGLPVSPKNETEKEQLRELSKSWAATYNKEYESHIRAKEL